MIQLIKPTFPLSWCQIIFQEIWFTALTVVAIIISQCSVIRFWSAVCRFSFFSLWISKTNWSECHTHITDTRIVCYHEHPFIYHQRIHICDIHEPNKSLFFNNKKKTFSFRRIYITFSLFAILIFLWLSHATNKFEARKKLLNDESHSLVNSQLNINTKTGSWVGAALQFYKFIRFLWL